MLREGDDSCDARLAVDGDDDESIQDGSLSRCHNRSVSHDSYFRLLMTNSRTGMQVDPLDEEGGDASPQAVSDECHQGQSNDAIYAEISKSATKSKIFFFLFFSFFFFFSSFVLVHHDGIMSEIIIFEFVFIFLYLLIFLFERRDTDTRLAV